MAATIMHPALLTLFRLKTRAQYRRLFRGLRSVKGIVSACFVIGFCAFGFVPMIFVGFLTEPTDPLVVRSIAPLGILAFCLFNLLLSKPEAGIPFLPAEVDFLFPGPFRRRDLLAYKIFGMVIGSLGMALMFSLFVLPHVTYWIAGFVAAFLVVLFLQLLKMSMSLIAATVAERMFTLGRRLMLVVIGILIAFGLALALSSGGDDGFLAVVTRFRESWIGRGVLAPFEVFGRTLAAETFYPELLGWGTVGLSMNAGLVLLLLRLDANFLETSVAASQKLYERIQSTRRGTMWISIKQRGVPRRIPRLPWMGGAGPIAWRQLSTALRSVRSMFVFFLLFGAVVGVSVLLRQKTPITMVAPGIATLAMMSIFVVPQLIRFDFRGDVDRIETLKTLPISSTAIVVGELLTPIVLATLLQILLVALIALFQQSLSLNLSIVVAFLVPINALVFELENLVFLLYPYRMGSGLSDFQAFGRQMLIALLKMSLLLLVAGCAAGVGGIGYFISGGSWLAFVIGSWVSAIMLAVGLVPAISWAYRRFDPSTDTPP